ncbi:hypothetical protein ACQEU8_03810 [Streptomyces sp. CA-250714]|uniref:hypothetical protein n=1 Tax=Streptomyces sp. CA-250714 TaxID=3240060 RepID=UPI003D8ADEDC
MSAELSDLDGNGPETGRRTSVDSAGRYSFSSIVDFYLSPLSEVSSPRTAVSAESVEAARPDTAPEPPRYPPVHRAVNETWNLLQRSTVDALRASAQQAHEWYQRSGGPQKVDGAISGFTYGMQGAAFLARDKKWYAAGVAAGMLAVGHTMVKSKNRTYQQCAAALIAAAGTLSYAYGASGDSAANHWARGLGQLAVGGGSAAIPWLGGDEPATTSREADPPSPYHHPAYGQGDGNPRPMNPTGGAANTYLPPLGEADSRPTTDSSRHALQADPRHQPIACPTPTGSPSRATAAPRSR